MKLGTAPPLWKAVLIYYAGVAALFAIIGLVGAGGSPAGALVGLGIVAASHFVPFVDPPQVHPGLALLVTAGLVGLAFLVLRRLGGWPRILVVVACLTAWLAWGFITLAISG